MLKKIVTFLTLCAVIMSLSACSLKEDKSDKGNLKVYYINSGAYESNDKYIEAVDYHLTDNEDLVNNALIYLGSPPNESGLRSALVKGTRIYSYELNDSVIDVTLSPAYLLLNELEKATLKCCLTLTLCGISEIESLNIYVDGKLVEEMLSVKMMIIEDTETNQFEKQIKLYFPDSNNYYLNAENRVLTVGQDVSLAEYVVEELIKSTQTDGLQPSIPDGTKLLSADIKNGVCTINFSSEFVDNRPGTAAGQRMTIYSIVNSLAELDDVMSVRFQVEGKNARGYEYIDIKDSFTAFDDIVYYPHEVSNHFATVYLGNVEREKMVKTPVVIRRDTEMSVEESIVKYILALHDIGGYVNLIPNALQLESIETLNGLCTVNLSAALLAEGNSNSIEKASFAIAAAIMDSGVAQQVTVIVDGEKYVENIAQYIDLIIE